VNKKQLTETDIRTKFITAILGPDGNKWDVMTQMLEELYFTKGRVIVRGKTVTRGWTSPGLTGALNKNHSPQSIARCEALLRRIERVGSVRESQRLQVRNAFQVPQALICHLCVGKTQPPQVLEFPQVFHSLIGARSESVA
jgi:hypothetical protein